jgi:hypothetical protein
LVKANGIYLLQVQHFKIAVDGINVIALSPQSPLGAINGKPNHED